ncbi:uncharacterized protein LOC132738181 [Ruditapes philippinarum]|uniref:uncharacterized protein LOC132738181 n=1 Tax=Ruditapes philippinarum TaxID=129788 RepID=UPI00295B0125|nr:uncharacterized protein LOC132738181 [Ruditapes philippinarum]
MIVRPVIKVIMVLEIINTLNANLNLTFVMKRYLVGNMDILKDTSILQEQLVFEKGIGNDSDSVISFNDYVVQTSNIIKTDTQDTIKRKKRFTHFSDMSNNSDITDISKRCLCPWKTKWNYDSRRTPVFIAKAICGNKCNFNFTSTQLSYLSDVLTSCEPFTRDIRIFKYNRESYLRNWPVACLCTTKPRSVISKPCKKGSKSYGKISHRRCPGVKKKRTSKDKRKKRRKQRRLKNRNKKLTRQKKIKRKLKTLRQFSPFRHRIF